MVEKGNQIIGWSELLGGAAGLLVLLPIAAIQRRVPLGVMYYVGSGVGFVFASLAGWRLLTGRPGGHELSLIVQLLQIVQLTAFGWAFQYAVGLQMLLKAGRGLFEVSPGVNATVWLGPTLVPAPSSIVINVFAIWASIYLGRALTRSRAFSTGAATVVPDPTPPSTIGPA